MRWYGILLEEVVFIGITSELEVVRWFVRKFKDTILVEDLGTSEEIAMTYLRDQIGQIGSEDYYILTMCSCNGVNRPLFRECDELAEEFALDWFVEDVWRCLRGLLACMSLFSNRFLADKGSALVQLVYFIYNKIVLPRHSGISIDSYINKDLLMMLFIEEEGELEYYGGV